MRVLRSGLVAVIVAMLTAAGLVVTSSPALAAGTGPWNDPSRFPVMSKYPDATTASDVPVSDRDAWRQETQALMDRAPQMRNEVLVGPGLAARGVQTVMGSGEAVKNGTALVARTCGTGTGCKKILQAGWGLLGLYRMTEGGEDQADVTTTDTDVDSGTPVDFGPGSMYPSTGDVWADVQWSLHPDSPEPGQALQFTHRAQRERPIVSIVIGVDYVVKATGEWGHHTTYASYPNGPDPVTDGLWVMGNERLDLEIRRVHVDERGQPGYRFSHGFIWGQEIFPEGSQLRSTTRCQQPGGAEYSITSAVSALGAASVGVPKCNAGDLPLWNELESVLPDGTVSSQSVQNLRPLSDPAYGPVEGDNPYPLCSGGNCLWVIKIGGTWCAKGVAGCTDWSQRPAEAKCFLGPYEMPLTRCGFLERSYENNPETVPATRPNSDGDPDTYEGPVVQPAPAPSATPRPTSTTTPRPVPTPSPSSSSSPSPSPSGSGQPNPIPCTSGQACPTPTTPAPETSACFPSGWSAFNPVEWVKRPVGCALREAFVPSPEVVTSVTTSIRTDVTSSGAGPIVTALGTPIEALGSGSGCDGIQFDLPIGGQSFHGEILNACSGSMATAAHISTAIVGLSTVLGGGLALLRLAGAGFGYNVRVSDGD